MEIPCFVDGVAGRLFTPPPPRPTRYAMGRAGEFPRRRRGRAARARPGPGAIPPCVGTVLRRVGEAPGEWPIQEKHLLLGRRRGRVALGLEDHGAVDLGQVGQSP